MDPFKALSQLASGELRGMRDSDLLLVTLAYLRELDQPHWPHSQPPIGAAWGALRQLPAEQLPDALARATALAARWDPERFHDSIDWHAASGSGLQRVMSGLDKLLDQISQPTIGWASCGSLNTAAQRAGAAVSSTRHTTSPSSSPKSLARSPGTGCSSRPPEPGR